MPSIQPPPRIEAFCLERLSAEVRRTQTVDYGNFGRSRVILKLKYGLLDAELELSRIATLGANWDSYGAPPPSATAIQESRRLLADLAGDLLLPTAVVPSAEGGVSIYFMNGDRTAYIETSNCGSQALVMYDLGETEVLELGTDVHRSEVATRILEYLR